MMNKTSLRKWLFNIATLFSAVGIAFLIIDELNTYKTLSIVLLVIGIGLFITSNFYREKRDRS